MRDKLSLLHISYRMNAELVYLFSHKLYLFCVYAVIYVVVAQGHLYGVFVGIAVSYFHARYLQTIQTHRQNKSSVIE